MDFMKKTLRSLLWLSVSIVPYAWSEKVRDILLIPKFMRWRKQHAADAVVFDANDRHMTWEYVAEASGRTSEILYLEFGVFEGYSIRQWSSLNKNPQSRFIGFDTFTGLPEHWQRSKPKGAFDVGGTLPQVDDSRVSFRQGMFQNTVPHFLKEECDLQTFAGTLIVHLDADLYSSTLFILTTLFQILPAELRQKTFLMFDEFSSRSHEFAAFLDAVSSYGMQYEVLCGTKEYLHSLAVRLR